MGIEAFGSSSTKRHYPTDRVPNQNRSTRAARPKMNGARLEPTTKKTKQHKMGATRLKWFCRYNVFSGITTSIGHILKR